MSSIIIARATCVCTREATSGSVTAERWRATVTVLTGAQATVRST